MVTILSNVTALAASRQLGVSKIGLTTAITRLTTGRRVNNAMDEAARLTQGNTYQANARNAAASVVTDQANYFIALNNDGPNLQKTQDAYRMAELEGGGNTATTEYTNLVALNGASSTAALAAIATSQATNGASMSSALSKAQTHGISAETNQGIADAYLGADMGAEMANLTKYQILMQAGTSALNNANQSAQTVMGLFR